jgi:hypothetical protein
MSPYAAHRASASTLQSKLACDELRHVLPKPMMATFSLFPPADLNVSATTNLHA